MTTNDEANSAQIAEIRARAERFVRPATAGDRDQWAVWDMARDVLALIEVAEAAQALVATQYGAFVGWDATGEIEAASARLEEALSKFESGGH